MASLPEEKRRQRDYLAALEEEQRKLLVFSRELPLSLKLITQAIENFRREMGGENNSATKPCRLASVHIWDSAAAEAFYASNLGEVATTKSNLVGVDAKRVRGAFRPFQREEPEYITAPTEARRDNGEDDKDKQPQGFPQPYRKQRRCWSAYLHRRFLYALEELGGSKRATPKQIRDLMKVDGLTNDEVKSHLQKFRLHTRRPVTTVHSSSTSGDGPAQTPHHRFLVVGGIWVPPTEYTSAEGCSPASKGSCSPVAWLPLELGLLEEQLDKKQRIVKVPFKAIGLP